MSAVLMALYTLGTALIAHRYWTKSDNYVANLESFYKNLAVIGGFLLLSIVGGGHYALDAFWGIGAR